MFRPAEHPLHIFVAHHNRESRTMRKMLLLGLGLCVLGAVWKAEEEEDGAAIAMSPFLAALALEAGIFLLRRHQGSLLSSVRVSR